MSDLKKGLVDSYGFDKLYNNGKGIEYDTKYSGSFMDPKDLNKDDPYDLINTEEMINGEPYRYVSYNKTLMRYTLAPCNTTVFSCRARKEGDSDE